ncbi:MAG: ATP-binding cassette domain-containing protein [Spirochaetales bacterium]|nr:ATP-binding cassette domain-containing protein [Spirochaetales bacterium]
MIRIENLTKYYNTTCAVENVSLEINKGDIVGLLGPNGAGKTTTLRILTCYLKPTSGNISVKDFNIHDHQLEIKKLMGYLPESAPLYKQMLVFDYLTYIADIWEIDKDKQEKRIHELADLCGLNEVMHKSIDELSKGYKQRVGLAHAMMSDPEILVLDEPTSGLDPNQRIEVRDIIKEIGKYKTIIVSTHILPEVESTCNRVVIIDKGTIRADDRTENLKKTNNINISLKNARIDDVKSALASINGVEQIRKSGGDADIMDVEIECNTKDDIRPAIYQAIKSRDWILVELKQVSTSLETIFRKITREV